MSPLRLFSAAPRRALASLGLTVAALALFAGAASAAERIFPQDRLQVKVLEWMPARGEYKQWEGVTGEYAVSPDQSVLFPFLGDVSTLDRSPDELARFISGELQRHLSLPLPPDVTISFMARAPIYVLGAVQTPGQVAYAANITPAKAVALAGGFYRLGGGDLRLERDVATTAGALETAENEAARLVARLGRLEAELADEAKVREAFDPAIPVRPTPAMLAEQQKLLEVRLEARRSRLESAANRKTLAENQLKALRDQQGNLQKQMDLTKQELASVNNLVNQGLAATSRSLTLERSSAELQSRRVDLDVAILQAQLAANQADRDAVELVTTFRTDAANDAQTTRGELDRRLTDIETSKKLLHEATVTAPTMALRQTRRMQAGIRFFLTRSISGQAVTTEIGRDEALQGGDTLQVQMEIDTSSEDVAAERPAAGEADPATVVAR
ncbi:sugar ABC transporter substrate-binding protein [Aureimonas endophytica]|uniref:Sugar ABC transporter substrate-binding protein n=1 Tax=Aureimonas endophytica TaxID=2027858 RepID=A0A916ZGG2_9HYPH|nr:polysaccharide biosynthesis/export family protein [Aureimonas endophytica]GGD95858.1 sugar ABC transporter substrate-binding protein [Aureimonas endophytica]